MAVLSVCDSCRRHVDTNALKCPFCGGDARTAPSHEPAIRMVATVYGGPPPRVTAPAYGLSPTIDTTRKGGVARLAIGVALFLPGLILFTVARDWLLEHFGKVSGDQVVVAVPRVVMLVIGAPMAVGYVLLMTGLYATLFGARGREVTVLWSLFRIAFGLVVTIGIIVVIMMTLSSLRR
jgi:hypothetical protein